MEKLLEEFMKDFRNGGYTELECIDVAIHELQLAINYLKQKRNNKVKNIYENLGQVSFSDLGE